MSKYPPSSPSPSSKKKIRFFQSGSTGRISSKATSRNDLVDNNPTLTLPPSGKERSTPSGGIITIADLWCTFWAASVEESSSGLPWCVRLIWDIGICFILTMCFLISSTVPVGPTSLTGNIDPYQSITITSKVTRSISSSWSTKRSSSVVSASISSAPTRRTLSSPKGDLIVSANISLILAPVNSSSTISLCLVPSSSTIWILMGSRTRVPWCLTLFSRKVSSSSRSFPLYVSLCWSMGMSFKASIWSFTSSG